MGQKAAKKRMLCYDLLRILAAFSVVMLHTSAQFWYELPVTDKQWLVANTYNALSRFGVPVFVMISGALFLSPTRELRIKKLYTHNILRLAVIYIVWSCVYGLIDSAQFGFSALDLKSVLREMLYGRYHLWYLPMIIGIYMLLPILRTWTANASRQSIEYFLLLFLLFQIGKETVNALFPNANLLYVTSQLSPYMVCGYLGYFVLGHYLAQYGPDIKYRRCFYLASVPAAVCNILLSCHISKCKGEPVATIDDSFGVFTFIIAVALFLFFTDKANRDLPEKTEKIIHAVSLDTLGVYVMHIAVLELLQDIGIHSMMFPNIIGIPLLAVLLFLACSGIAALLRRIPVIGRYIC